MFLKIFNPMTICLAFGIFLMIAGIVLRIRETIHCTQEVDAECVSVNYRYRRRHRHRRPIQSPVWRYYWNGKTYFREDQNGNSMINYRAGEKCTLRIDPNKPERFYRKGMSNAVITIVVGCIWTVFILVGMNLDRIMDFILRFV